MQKSMNVHQCKQLRVYKESSACGTIHWLTLRFRGQNGDPMEISVFCDDIEFDPMTIELRKGTDDE